MASGGESAPLVEDHERRIGNVKFADESIDLGKESPRNQSISSSNSFNLHFPEFLRSFSVGSDQDSDFDELDGLPDVEFPESGPCFDVDEEDGAGAGMQYCKMNNHYNNAHSLPNIHIKRVQPLKLQS